MAKPKPPKKLGAGAKAPKEQPARPTAQEDTTHHGDPMKDHEALGHMRTLMDAEMIKNDPEKMRRVHMVAKHHSRAIRSVEDLKREYDRLNKAERGEGEM